MKTFDVKGKTALVTGANRGIGRAYVDDLVKRGAKKVYAAVRDKSSFNSLQDINSTVVEPVLLDVTQQEHINKLVNDISELDLLINNAGIINGCFFTAENAIEIARLEMETNYYGPLNIIHAFLPRLKQSKGAIVNISSIAGISNFPSIGPYSATKAALHSLTQGLRTELHKDDILVAGVYPGPIDTRMAEDFEMDKAPPAQVAEQTIDAISRGEVDIFPDDFSKQMYGAFLNNPADLEKAFAEMH